MKRILIGLAFGIILTAQPYGRPSYNDRAHNDRGAYAQRSSSFAARIAQGERMGLLTRREAARLWDMERDLRIETERGYRSGFGLSGRERARIEHMRAQLDREITRQMRDGERNYRPGYR